VRARTRDKTTLPVVVAPVNTQQHARDKPERRQTEWNAQPADGGKGPEPRQLRVSLDGGQHGNSHGNYCQ